MLLRLWTDDEAGVRADAAIMERSLRRYGPSAYGAISLANLAELEYRLGNWDAALAGNVAAQNLVAKLYRLGVGVEGNPIEAAAWYVLARRAGLDDREMNIFMDGLTTEQQKTAIERANRLR